MDYPTTPDPVKIERDKLDKALLRNARMKRASDFHETMELVMDEETLAIATETFRSVIADGVSTSLTMTQIGAACLIALGYQPSEIKSAMPGMVTTLDLNMWGAKPDFVDCITKASKFLSGRAEHSAAQVDYSNITYENAQELVGALIKSHVDVLRQRSLQYGDDPLLSSGLLVETYKNIAGTAVLHVEYDTGLVDGLLKSLRELLKLKNLYKPDEEDDNTDHAVLQIIVGEGVPTRAPAVEDYGKEPG